MLPVHTAGGAQSAADVATVQLALHTLVAALHRNPPGQLTLATAPQVAAPLHSRAGVSTAPVGQLPATHTVPAAKRRQAPAPSQVPSVPQLAAPWSAHWLATTGGRPAATGTQAAPPPASAQAWQVPQAIAAPTTQVPAPS